MKRTMIIVWKWHEMEALSGKSAPGEAAAVSLPQHDVFRVTEENADPDTTNSRACVVRLKVTTGQSNEAMPYLLQLANQYADKGQSAVFLFLHRRDGFTPEHVRQVLDQSLADKCFLFGEGRDRLYYLNGIGLLGENGKFMYQPPEQGRPEVKVADYDQQCVFQPFFDKTWNYYAHEFGAKIFELKEDVLGYFCGIFPPEQNWHTTEYFNYLQQNKSLLLRLKSFINDGRLATLSESEEQALEQLELKTKKSYRFDDCRKNLEKVHRIDADFDQLAQTLLQWLFDKDHQEGEKKSLSEYLSRVQIQFQNLIDAIADDVEK